MLAINRQMVTQKLKYKDEARKLLAEGANDLAKAVVSTLGPLSRNVAIIQAQGTPAVIHDGVTVARNIRFKDPYKDIGAMLIKEAAGKTADIAGDGTTTATLLANTLFQEGLKIISGGLVDGVIRGTGENPMKLREALLKYSEEIIAKIEKKSVKVTDKKDYQKIAEISSNSPEIGKLVADAIEKVGENGVVMVEQAGGYESDLSIEEGIEFENGWLSPYLVTDPNKMIAEYDDAYILLTNYTIADAMMLVPIIEKVIQDNNKPLLIIAEDVVGAALQAISLTKLKAGAKLVAVIAPEFGDRRKEMLEDLAILTGGYVIDRNLDKKLQDVKLSDLGRAKHIEVTQTHTRITPKDPDVEEIQERINVLKEQIDSEDNKFKKERLEYRLGKLSQKVAIIRVGAASNSEYTDKRERTIDAVYATKAALAEGVVAGGGVTLRDIGTQMFGTRVSDPIEGLVYKALRAPFETILTNAGYKDIAITKEGAGINVVTNMTVDMVKEGIIDPAKVTKLAVRYAFSVAATMLTTDTLIADEPEEKNGNANV